MKLIAHFFPQIRHIGFESRFPETPDLFIPCFFISVFHCPSAPRNDVAASFKRHLITNQIFSTDTVRNRKGDAFLPAK